MAKRRSARGGVGKRSPMRAAAGFLMLLGYAVVRAHEDYVYVDRATLPDGFCTGALSEASCCENGSGSFLLPFIPFEHTWDRGFRAFLYLMGLLWVFLGVSILCDAFMNGIEAITSETKKKKVPIYDENGKKKRLPDGSTATRTVETEVWNPSVANLTLMALGSSTPEILLNCIETVGNQFYSGELGPGTVVGSAAFNLLIISALSISAVPHLEIRRIEKYSVFLLTAIHSMIAYAWLVIIVQVSTPNIVDIWEAAVTLGLMPWLTFWVWCADREWFRSPQVFPAGDEDQEEGLELGGGTADGGQEHLPRGASTRSITNKGGLESVHHHAGAKAHAHHPTYAQRKREAMRGICSAPQSIQAARRHHEQEEITNPSITFLASRYQVMENVGEAKIAVKRMGPLDSAHTVLYHTIDGTAKAGQDYEASQGKITFGTGEEMQEIRIKIMEDDQWNEDKDFTVELTKQPQHATDGLTLDPLSKTLVTIIDCDHPGEFSFLDSTYIFKCTDSKALLVLERRQGSAGTATVRLTTTGGTAEAGKHFEATDTVVVFQQDQAASFVSIPLTAKGWPQEEPDNPTLRFFAELSDPTPEGGATLGKCTRVEILLRWCSMASKAMTFEEEQEKEPTWGEQFRLAMTVENPGEASITENVMHYVTVFWKIFAALVPPVSYWNGKATFLVALLLIGFVTTLINDLSSILGCLVGLKDSVTAITLVAMGTSLPDTFASIMAARQDTNADNSIGNITGSNSVNVFLGIGLPWLIAAIYWPLASDESKDAWRQRWAGTNYPSNHPDTAFVVEGGNLAFNTLIFTILALVCLALLTFRRNVLGAELGGHKRTANSHAALLAVMWMIYILVSSIQVYHPQNFPDLTVGR